MTSRPGTTKVTLFTAPKAFDGLIGVIQANAIRSWLALGPDVDVLVVGDDAGVKEAAVSLSVRHLAGVQLAESGAPSLRSTFEHARRAARGPILCYLNADIVLLDDFLPAVDLVAQRFDRFLIAGQRWDVRITEPLRMEDGWQAELRQRAASSGSRHRPVGSDYFVFPADQYGDLPDFTVGRSGWDNWMIYDGRRRRLPVVDASDVITVVHQNHDYAHLPGGAPHHRHPESQRNIDLAGGREVIFRLEDADWRLSSRGLVRKGAWEYRYPRRWEADLTARIGPGRPARLVRMILRPVQTVRYLLSLRPGRGGQDAAGAGREPPPQTGGSR